MIAIITLVGLVFVFVAVLPIVLPDDRDLWL